MRKSMWLLSAGVFAISDPGLCAGQQWASDRRSDARRRHRRPRLHRPSKTRAMSSSSPPRAAPRRFRTFRSPSPAVNAEIDAEQRRDRHPRSSTSWRPRCSSPQPGTEANGSARIRGIGTVGDNPGLESSVAGVHRRRLSLALGHRPQRAWRNRPGRSRFAGRKALCSAAMHRPAFLHIFSKKPSVHVRRLA